MINYFDSIKLYSWNLTEREIEIFEKKLNELEWKIMLIINLGLSAIMGITTYFLGEVLIKSISTSIPNQINTSFLVTFIPNFLLSFIFLFGGYYFTKLFFKTKITITQFYTLLAYLYLPLLSIYVLINIITLSLTFFVGNLAFFAYLLYIPMFYYGIKELNTSIYLFTKEFNTNQWVLIGVVLFWGILTSIISHLINIALFSLV